VLGNRYRQGYICNNENIYDLPSKPGLLKFWIKLSGDPSEFPLNARIFHSVCLISIFALSYNVPFNYLIGLPDIALASLVVLLITAGLYYASRIKKRVSESILVINIVGLLLFIVNYLLNSGQRGPTDLFFLLFLLLSIGISPVKQYKIWIPVNIGIMLTLNLIEYLYPEIAPVTYQNRFSQFVDHMSAYAVVASITYFCTDYIRRSYEAERASVAEKSKAIELQNDQITLQNQELERLNAEKSKLMSIVAHDLRSPLASIQNFLELLTQHELEEKQKLEIENDLLNSTKNTLSMLSKLLDWSKSQLYGVSPHPEYLNLSKAFEITLEIEKSIASVKGITLDYYFDPAITIFADNEMMQLILRNLIGNAIKFTADNGQIIVRAETAPPNCLISIQDNGIGIALDRQASIFSLNADSTYGTKNEKGVGLGLLLCMEFIKAQGGEIWFQSQPESGTCFYISIPMKDSNYI
jgi:two-component system sensor histidine kinase/response regulator